MIFPLIEIPTCPHSPVVFVLPVTVPYTFITKSYEALVPVDCNTPIPFVPVTTAFFPIVKVVITSVSVPVPVALIAEPPAGFTLLIVPSLIISVPPALILNALCPLAIAPVVLLSLTVNLPLPVTSTAKLVAPVPSVNVYPFKSNVAELLLIVNASVADILFCNIQVSPSVVRQVFKLVQSAILAASTFMTPRELNATSVEHNNKFFPFTIFPPIFRCCI